jgi:D-arabinose 1-dehydrogenase-like Zn-dependent alcohol dehydrogenase
VSSLAKLGKRRKYMNPKEKLVVIGCGGVGGPASILAKKLMPDVEIINIRAEKRFIVR